MSIPTKIYIIPYRDRRCHKVHFEIYMKYILEDFPSSDYEIFYIHQCDNRPFNRGAMKNIGFLVMKTKYPDNYKNITFIFNDIDTMPATKNLLNYNTTIGTVKHFYGYTFALGGIFSITGADFEKCNGFPNLWGWGIEDNCINLRVLQAGIKIDRNNFYNILDQNILQLNEGLTRLLSKQEAWRLVDNTVDSFLDIKNLEYTIDNEFVNVQHFDTKYNPTNDTFYKKHANENLGKIKLDTKFKINNNNQTNLKKQWKMF